MRSSSEVATGFPDVGERWGLASAVDAAAAEDVAALPVEVLADDVAELHRQLARLQGQILRRVAAVDAVNGGQIQGHMSTASWLRGACSMTSTQASGLLKTARMMRSRPQCAVALETGRIGYAHAQVLSATLADLPIETHDAAEPILLEAAERLDPGRLRIVATRLRETINREEAERNADRDYGRRRLHVSTTLDGMVIVDGLFDAESGGVLLTALMPVAKSLGPDNDRTPAQRRADALVEIANQMIKTGHLPTVASHRPNLNVTISLESLQKQPGTPGGELDWAGPITAQAARHIGCDAEVTRIVLGTGSEILDVGRAQRLVTPSQRKALAVRDRGCIWPGCDRPPWWTDAHHVVAWADGGTTDLANLTLLCRAHHRKIHEQGSVAQTRKRKQARAP